MVSKQQFSCYIIGTESLTTQCAELLIKQGHQLLGIISSSLQIRDWADKNQIPWINPATSYELILSNTEFDYLFSIVNMKILPHSILKCPRRLAINYHDSLLPKYAGIHAPSWAIYNNEKYHGITWHIMDDIVDTGDILKQVTIPIDKQETTLSLNLKCYQAAINSFSELIHELATDTYVRTIQQLDERSYFSFSQKPPHNGWINWDEEAKNIERLCRALNFGNYTNRLSLPKFIVNNSIYIVENLKLLKKRSIHKPGTVVKLTKNLLQIATRTNDIALVKIKTLDNQVCKINTFTNHHGLHESIQLPTPNIEKAQEYSLISHNNHCYEFFWFCQLRDFYPATLPFLNVINSSNTTQSICTGKFHIAESMIKKLKSQYGVKTSLTDILLTAWLIYLYRIGNQDTPGVFYNHAGLEQFKSLNAFLTTRVPFTVRLKNATNFKQALDVVSKQRMLIEKNGTYLLDIKSRYPQLNNVSEPIIEVILTDTHIKQAKPTPITLIVTNKGRTLELYAYKNLLNDSFISFTRNIFGHLQTLLAAATADPTQLISQLPLLMPEEHKKIVIDWNKTEAKFPHNKTIHQLFEKQVEITPDNIAVIFEDKQLTYRELNNQSNQLAQYLKKYGTDNETLIAVCMERSLEMIIAILGIIKAGGAYVPVDPTYPNTRIKYVLEDTNAKIILTQAKFNQKLKSYKIKLVDLDKGWAKISKESQINILQSSTPKNWLYVIYTSGSTGNPKGVINTHQAVVNRIDWMQKQYKLQKKDRILQKTPFSFDVSVWEFFWPLLNGNTLVVAKPEIHKEPEALIQTILKQKITVIHFVPSMLSSLIQTQGIARCANKLRLVFSSGEALSYDLMQKFLKQFKSTELHNLYGPTEAAIDVTHWHCTEYKQQHIVPIGKPIANTQLYILDSNHQVLPIGVAGELYIGGIGVAQGYLNRPELTAERFLSNPFTRNKQSKLYCTGDIVRYLPDGNIEYLDRKDQQVKLKGFRIELNEINNALVQHPNIAEAVTLLQAVNSNKQLVAYYVKNKQKKSNSINLDNHALQNFLKKLLPQYMIPAAFYEIEKIPVNSNGKIDREVLIKLQKQPHTSAHIKLPSTHEEKVLTEIWKNVLKLQNISIEDDFFALGGDSIKAMEIVAKAKKINLLLTVQDIFLHTSIHNLAKKLVVTNTQQIEQADKIEDIDELNEVYSANTYPLSHMQKGLLFHQIYTPNSEAYSIQLSWPPNKNIDINILRQSWEILIEHHELLRTSFQWEDVKEPIQIVHDKVKLPFYFFDWSNQENLSEESLNSFLQNDRQTSFNLSEAPLLRLTAIKLPKNYFRVVLTIHHILVDGWAVSLLLKELKHVYQGISFKKNYRLAKTYPYLNYIKWLQKQKFIAAKNFWTEYLKDLNTPNNLAILKRIHQVLDNTASIDYQVNHIELSHQLTLKLKTFCQDNKITLNTIFQGIWGLLLGKYNQSYDVIFGVVLTERTNEISHSDQIIGPLVNTLPLRINLKESISIIEYLKQVQVNLLEISRYRHTPLINIQALSSLQNNNQLFDSIMAFENYPIISTSDPFFKFSNIQVKAPTHYPLSIAILPEAKLTLKIGYNKNLIEHNAIQQLGNHLVNLITQIINEPYISIHQINILSDLEYKKILTEWNSIDKHFSYHESVNQLFEKQVNISKGEIAVVFNKQSLTYEDLNNKANQLAWYLKQRGIVPGKKVAICMERSIDIVITILATLKAGGSYIPIDPENPNERIAYILQDSAPSLLLTQANLQERFDKKLISPNKIFCFDSDWNFVCNNPKNNLNIPVSTDNLMYTIYTSGSTGKPKGVLLPQKTIINLVTCQQSTLKRQNVTQLANSSFDVSVQEIFYTLLNGYKLFIVPTLIKKSPIDLLNFIEQWKINQLFLPTALLDILANEANSKNFSSQNLKTLIVAGEALKITPPVRQFFINNPHISLINHYGPSETHVVTSFTLPNDAETWGTMPAIGKPINGVQAYVLDRNNMPTAIYVPGELHISGVSLAHGYLNLPQLTKEKFISNPFSNDIKSRLYKTGDLVRWLPDGNLEYIGRSDDQIKIRGFRVELSEIEACLQKHNAVRQAVVIMPNKHEENKILLAYLVAKQHKKIVTEEIRNFLKDFLPAYMMPLAFIRLDKFPLTANGKIDKKSLPIPKLDELLPKRKYVAPLNAIEKALAAIWSSILHVEKISIYDNFFELGGHSLSALQLLTQIKAKFMIELNIRILFDSPTIAEIAPIIESLEHNHTVLSLITTEKNSLGYKTNCLVALNSTGNKLPLFLIHPVGGTVFWYKALAKYLDKTRSVYGIQDPSINSKHIIFENVEEMASFYIDVIRTVQPHGPYLLGGASAGATTSIEMARQLNLLGEETAFIGLLDGWALSPNNIFNKDLLEASLIEQYNAMQSKFTTHGITSFESLLELQRLRTQQNASYKIPTLTYKLTLFKAMENNTIYKDFDATFNYWDKYALYPIELHEVPGNHETIFEEPNVKILATKLNNCLNKINFKADSNLNFIEHKNVSDVVI